MSRSGWSRTRWCLLVAVGLLACLVVGVVPAAGAGGAVYVDKSVARDCAGLTPCYQHIQAGVKHAQPGDTIYVFPGTYEEGVDLKQMETEGNITLITVDANGNPTPGTVTIDNPADTSEIYTGDPVVPFDGDVTIDGFVVRSEYGGIDVWAGSTTPAPQGGEATGALPLGWDVEIRNVDASHTGGDGILARAYGNVTIKDCTANYNKGVGIVVGMAFGDVTITGCTANHNNAGPAPAVEGVPWCWSGGICVVEVFGDAKIKDSTANSNAYDGIHVDAMLDGEALVPVITTRGEVIVDRCTANQNEDDGIDVRCFGDVTITNCTANDNGGSGVSAGGFFLGEESGATLPVDGGDVLIENCTANGNKSGFDAAGILGILTIRACIARENGDGVALGLEPLIGGDTLVNGNIICGNECGVSLGGSDSLGTAILAPNLEGNWWGCAGGPEAAGCDPICEVDFDSLAVDFTPWISKITDSATVDPVNVGESTVVSFQFQGGPPTVYLGEGPGDLRGPAPFTVHTDNGTLNGNGATVQEFVGANGILEVTLVPDTGGTATVTVSGPCGLADLEGAEAVLAVESEFVPEPGSVLLLGSGLMGLAGYAALRRGSGQGLRLRKR
jgi:parallel beta-helix repeat protein